MTDSVYARAYARALFRAAEELGTTPAVREDVRALEAQWAGSPELRLFCRRHLPGNAEHHAALIDAVWGKTFSSPMIQMLKVLAERDQLGIVPLIIPAFDDIADRSLGCARVKAEFAVAPDGQTLDGVRALAVARHGESMHFQSAVRPDLLAGFRLTIDDRRIDASLAGRLARLRIGLRKPAAFSGVTK